MIKGRPKCNDTRLCFAKYNGYCTVLSASYPDGLCPFCKLERGYSARDLELYMERMGKKNEKPNVHNGLRRGFDADNLR